MYRVLYVDDEPGLLEVARIFLERGKEITVDTRTSATAALPLLETGAHDAIISDYQMPGMDGIAFLKKVRASGNSIPFILFTGKGREEVVIQALNEGADFYLQKGGDPVSQFIELANKIRYAINSRRAELTLQEKTRELDQFFSCSLDLLCIADTRGYFRRLNPEWERTLGYSVQELEGMKFLDFVHPDDLARTMDAVSSLQDNKEILNFENRYRHRDGSYRWIEWRSYPFGNMIYAAARDITERRRAAEVLRESEEKFRNLYTNMVEGSALHQLVTDGNGIPLDYTILEVNPAFERILGISRDSVVGKASREVYGVEKPPFLEIYARVAETGLAERFETYFSPLDKHFSISVYRTAPGMFATVFEDITKRKRAEDALLLEKTFIDAIFNSVPGMIYLYDAEGKLVRWNQKHELMTGYSSEELAQMTLPDWYRGDEKSIQAVTEGIRAAMETGFGEAEADLQRKDKTKIPMYFTASPLTIQGKQYFAGIGIDITDRRLAEETIRSSEEKYRRIVETSIEGIWSMNDQFETVFVNRRIAEMLGYSQEEMLGHRIMDFMDPGELADNETRLVNRRSGINEFYERRFKRKDGSIRWFGVSVTALMDHGGKFTGSFAMLTDITGRKLAEEELRKKNDELRATYEQIAASEEELRQNLDEITEREKDLQHKTIELENRNQLVSTLLDTIPIGIFMVEAPSGKPIMANREAARLLGRGILPDATEENLSEVYEAYRLSTGGRYPAQEMPIVRGMRGETSHIDDMVVVRPDGTRVRLEVFGNPVRDFEGRIIASLVSFIDISWR